jgi:hypothetical protein
LSILNSEQGGNIREDFRLHCDTLLAYLGTATVVALVYFQWANDWVLAAWAVIILALFAMAYSWKRQIFLDQALFLTCGVCARGITHILFGAGILIMLLALAVNERSFRLTGLVLLLLSVAKVLAIDAWGLAPRGSLCNIHYSWRSFVVGVIFV